MSHHDLGIGAVVNDAPVRALLLPDLSPAARERFPHSPWIAAGPISRLRRCTWAFKGPQTDAMSAAGIIVKSLPIRHSLDVAGRRRLRHCARVPARNSPRLRKPRGSRRPVAGF